VHQVEQRANGALRGTFIGPHDDLGREHVHPAELGDPCRGDPVAAADGEMIDAVLPLVGGGQRDRSGPGPQQYTVKPSATTSSSMIGFQDDKLAPAERKARTLIFDQHELAAFIAGAKNGDFDHLLD
jgi:hypothetical protein